MPHTFSVGDPVLVDCFGLAMLRHFAPAGAAPNHHGVVASIEEDGNIMVEFPIGDDPDHSQVAPYPAELVRPR